MRGDVPAIKLTMVENAMPIVRRAAFYYCFSQARLGEVGVNQAKTGHRVDSQKWYWLLDCVACMM